MYNSWINFFKTITFKLKNNFIKKNFIQNLSNFWNTLKRKLRAGIGTKSGSRNGNH
jgi:hypothetical protein